MSQEDKYDLTKFDETVLVRINPKDSTLPIDTAAEWSKGFIWINKICSELLKERYVEEFEDDSGETRYRTKFHPQLLAWFQERRRLMDQIYKISGNEAVNEIKKEVGKLAAKAIFEGNQSGDIKEENKEYVKKIIEADYLEEIKGED